jgi:predicted metal-dependent hydrolase
VFEEEHLLKMREGVELYNQQKYWESHEALEDIWAEDAHDPVRFIYWAVIQAAAVCIHYRDQNLIGCQGMIAKAKEKLKRCRELHILSQLALNKLNWHQFEEIITRIPSGNESKLEHFKELFDFRFTNSCP